MLLEKLIAAPPGDQTAMDKILLLGQSVYVHSMKNEFKVLQGIVSWFFSVKMRSVFLKLTFFDRNLELRVLTLRWLYGMRGLLNSSGFFTLK